MFKMPKGFETSIKEDEMIKRVDWIYENICKHDIDFPKENCQELINRGITISSKEGQYFLIDNGRLMHYINKDVIKYIAYVA